MFVFVVENVAHVDVKDVGVRVGEVVGLFVYEGCLVGELTTTAFATAIVP